MRFTRPADEDLSPWSRVVVGGGLVLRGRRSNLSRIKSRISSTWRAILGARLAGIFGDDAARTARSLPSSPRRTPRDLPTSIASLAPATFHECSSKFQRSYEEKRRTPSPWRRSGGCRIRCTGAREWSLRCRLRSVGPSVSWRRPKRASRCTLLGRGQQLSKEFPCRRTIRRRDPIRPTRRLLGWQ